MRWIRYEKSVIGKEVDGGDPGQKPTAGHATPFIAGIIRNFLWQDVVTLDLKEEAAKAGYRVGYVVGGKTYVTAVVLNDTKVGLTIGPQKYKVFAIDRDGREIDFVPGSGRLHSMNTWLNDYYVF